MELSCVLQELSGIIISLSIIGVNGFRDISWCVWCIVTSCGVLLAVEDRMAEKLLTVAQVAEVIQAHPRTVQRWIREGRLPARRLGGQKLGYRIAESDLEDFLKGDQGQRESESGGVE
jgi:excisionase family DNA binding protein